jgi:multiple sugar transport system permease protein
MLASLYYSFCDYSGFAAPQFVGFGNYIRMFSGEDVFFFKSIKATFYYTLLSVPVYIVFAFAIALLMNREFKGRAFFRSVFYVPTMVPAVASAIIWIYLMNPDQGLLNLMLKTVGLPTSKWVYAENTVIPSIVLMGMWGTGSTMVIFLSGLQQIPSSYYEVVDESGGNAFHKLIYVTIPLMTPTIFFNTVMALIGSFQVFTQAYIITQGGPNMASHFLVYYLYREAFTNGHMGYASSLAWLLFLIIGFFVGLMFLSQKKWVYYEGGSK